MSITFSGNKKTKNRLSKKSQITVFLIIGILLFLLLSIFIYIFYQDQEIKDIDFILKENLKSKQIRQYTADCLASALEESVILLAGQGGYFYQDQEGNIFPYDLPHLPENKISYLIYPRQGTYKKDSYPFFYNPGIDTFSENRLPSLDIVKRQLQKRIQLKALECISSDQLRSFLGNRSVDIDISEIDLEKGAGKVDISFNPSSVSAIFDLPIDLSYKNQKKFSSVLESRAETRIRFKPAYDIILDLIQKEIEHLDFDITEDYKKKKFKQEPIIYSSYDSFEINFYESEGDKIISLKDMASKVNNTNLIFNFAIKNRPPVVKKIQRYPSSKDRYDVLKFYNDSIDIEQKIKNYSDPDDEKVEFELISGSNILDDLKQKNNTNYGYHNITFSLKDKIKRYNYTVKVLIEPPLSLNQTEFFNHFYFKEPLFRKNYPQDKSIATLEDPYYINISSNSFDPDIKYDYEFFFRGTDTASRNPIRFKTNLSCIVLPTLDSCSSSNVDIETITSKIYRSTGFKQPGTGFFAVTAKAYYNGINITNNFGKGFEPLTEINIFECYPYHNPYSQHSYPFHNSSDPFLSKHECCNHLTNKFRTAGTACYTEKCSGGRGNICGRSFDHENTSWCDEETCSSPVLGSNSTQSY